MVGMLTLAPCDGGETLVSGAPCMGLFYILPEDSLRQEKLYAQADVRFCAGRAPVSYTHLTLPTKA